MNGAAGKWGLGSAVYNPSSSMIQCGIIIRVIVPRDLAIR